MGLDASVYCDCFERGELLNSPLPEWNVYVDETGSRCERSSDPAQTLAFDRWNHNACKHPHGKLLSHHLGNISGIGLIRNVLSKTPALYPVILSRIIHSGTHCGDFLTPDQVLHLRQEIPALCTIHFPGSSSEQHLRIFERQLNELSEAAIRLERPICF